MAKHEALKLDLPSTSGPPPPSIAALFLVKFDHRKGYVVAWQKAIAGVEVEGAVEYKSLPSGLHNVAEDLVYFIHERYAGISAFVNRLDEEAARNANMLAVGALVPLERGRIGKAWLHAEGLKELAKKQLEHASDSTVLDEYWQEYKTEDDDRPPVTPQSASVDSLLASNQVNGNAGGYQKLRSMSAGSVFLPGSHSISPHHPVAALVELLHLFGPLIFPLYRAALLRKRVLLVSEAPVEFACNIVYNLSILSSLPRSLVALLPTKTRTTSSLRSTALFNVGIHDIPTLSSRRNWIACTTDDVLASKPECFDLLVFLPSADSRRAQQRIYPKIVLSSPTLTKTFPKHGIRSTQRDASRYEVLRSGMKRYPPSQVTPAQSARPQPSNQATDSTEPVTPDTASTLSASSTIASKKEIVEPASWSQVAYTSLLWWASAGARRDGLALTEEEDMERERDETLLDENDEGGLTKEVLIVGFFRRLTGVMVETMAQLARGDDEYRDDEGNGESDDAEERASQTQEEDAEPAGREGDERERLLSQQTSDDQHDEEELDVNLEDLSAMMLDIWSASDRKFVEEFVSLYFGRKAQVRGGRVECCGVRIL